MMTMLLVTLAAVAGEPETIDVSALLRVPGSEHAPTLGIATLRSGAFFGYDEEPAAAERDAGWIAGVVREALGDGEGVELLGGRLLLVPAERAHETRTALASLAADLLRTVRVRIEARLPDGSVVTGEVAARDGRWATLDLGASRTVHADDDVEIACSDSAESPCSVIADPIVKEVREGLAVDVRPSLLGDGDAVALEVVVQAGRIEEPPTDLPLEATYHGRIRLPRHRGVAAAAGGRVKAGEALAVRLSGPDGETTVRLAPRVEGRPGNGKLRMPPDALAHSSGVPFEPERWEDPAWSRLAALPWPIHGAGSSFAPATTVFAGSAADARTWADAVAARQAPLARTILVTVRVLAGETELARAELPALAGRTAVARIGRDRMIVSDWDVEVGCYNQIGDPNVSSVFSGVELRLQPEFAPDGSAVLLDLAFRRAEVEVRPPPPSGMVRTGAIHAVTATERPVNADLALPDGGEARLPLGLDEDGRALTLVVNATIAR